LLKLSTLINCWRNNYCFLLSTKYHLYNKRVCPTKNEPQLQGISYLEREREEVREKEEQAGRSAGRLI